MILVPRHFLYIAQMTCVCRAKSTAGSMGHMRPSTLVVANQLYSPFQGWNCKWRMLSSYFYSGPGGILPLIHVGHIVWYIPETKSRVVFHKACHCWSTWSYFFFNIIASLDRTFNNSEFYVLLDLENSQRFAYQSEQKNELCRHFCQER